MTDPSSPLLSRVNLSESGLQSEEKESRPSLDDTIEECIGCLGPAQLVQTLLVSIAWIFDAQQTFINVFTDAEPSWDCSHAEDPICCSATGPKHSWPWTEPARESIISEWGLMCAGPLVAGLPASAFFAGCLAGGLLLATLADSRLGRKNMLLISCLIMSVAGVLTAFSPNVWAYSALRFIGGIGRATIGTSALVLSTEFIGKKWRGQIGVIGFFCFTFGFLSLPAIAYFSRGSSWRTLYLWTSIPTILYCILIKFCVYESPRWLFVRGRKEEAIQILGTIAKANGKMALNSSCFSQVYLQEETWNVDVYSSLKILWTKRWAFRRLSAVMVVGLGVGLVYYGMPLGVGNLNFNLYLSTTLNALAELPSSLVTLLLIGRMNRKVAVLGFTTVSGICSVLCVLVGGGKRKGLQIGVEVVSFFSACSAFNVLLIYTLELFPTSVRNSALSMVRQALVLGGVFSPMLVVAGRKDGFLSYGVFGLVIGACGFSVTFLPETRKGGFCDTMEEEEYNEIAASNGVNA
ncbi:hypothetical protein AAC387_Pa06g2086 [Persea americana]